MTADQRQIAGLGGQLLTSLYWGVADDGEAEDLVAHLSDRLTDPACAGALLAHRASLATFSGNPSDGLQLLNLFPEVDDPMSFCQIAVTRSMTLTLAGRDVDGLAVAERALELHRSFSEPLLLPHPSIHEANAAFALFHGGHPDSALSRAMTAYGIATDDRMIVSLVWCQLVAGDACLTLGRGAEAAEHFAQALHDASREHFRGQVAMAWAGIARARASLGDLAGAEEAMQICRAEPPGVKAFAPSIAVAEATVMAAFRNFGSACSELHRQADESAQGGNVIGEAWMLHELARLGMSTSVAPRLIELAGTCDNAMVRVRTEFCRAMAADDAGAVSSAGERFAELGCPIFAAEAMVSAADLFGRRAEGRRANAATLRAAAMLSGCDFGPPTYVVRSTTVTPLTAREREIAYLAAEGATNREISERLFLSLRTVENHLSKVFFKLGISSRQELRSVVGPLQK